MKVVGSMRDSIKSVANKHTRELLCALGHHEEVVRELPVPLDTDLFVQWGFKPTVALRSAMELDIPYVIIDLGYFDINRSTCLSLSINGFHGLSMQHPDVSNLPERPKILLRPWSEGGEEVIILGQMPGDQAVRGQDIDAWMGRAATHAIDTFGKRVVKRPHPKMLNPWEPRLPRLEETFDSTYAYVSWTSTAAVQTIAAGVPTIVEHPASIAWPVRATLCGKALTGLDREAWLHDVASRQYDFKNQYDIKNAAKYILSAYAAAREASKEKL